MHFKDEYHEDLYYALKRKRGLEYDSKDYNALFFCMSAIGKPQLADFISDGVKTQELLKEIEPFSSSEKALVKAGLSLFNSNVVQISFDDAFYSLDLDNTRVLLDALKMRYL